MIATAQDLANSEKALDQSVELVKAEAELAAEFESHDRTNGKRALILSNDRRYMVAASGRRAARGWSADDLDMDELREQQNWEAWAAAAPTTLARMRSQIWAWSNAGDAASIVLRCQRAAAMRDAIGAEPGEAESFAEGLSLTTDDGDEMDLGQSLAIFEWSAKPGASLSDWDARAQANPSLGHGFLTARKLNGLIAATPDEWTARQEYLCQWRSTASGGPFPDGAWDAGIDPAAESMIDDTARVAVGVDVSADGGLSYIAIATYRTDGHVYADVIERRAGTHWVLDWLLSPERVARDRWGAVAWQVNGAPVSALTDDLRAAGMDLDEWANHDQGLPLANWSGPDLSRASGVISELVRLPEEATKDKPAEVKQRLFHRPNPALDVPASTAVPAIRGDTWVLSREKSPVDCAPLIAVFAAVWALGQAKTPYVSAYADHDLMVV